MLGSVEDTDLKLLVDLLEPFAFIGEVMYIYIYIYIIYLLMNSGKFSSCITMIISAVTETTFKPTISSSDPHHHHHHNAYNKNKNKIRDSNESDNGEDSEESDYVDDDEYDKNDMFDFYDNEEVEIIALPPQGTLDLSFSNTKVTLSESTNPTLLQIIVTKGNAISRILTDVSIANILGHDCDSEIKRILTLDIKGINLVRTEHNTQKKIVTIPSTQLDMCAIEPFSSTPSHDSRIIIIESFRTKFKDKINVSVNYTDYNLLFTMKNTLMKSLNKPNNKSSVVEVNESSNESKKSIELILPPDTEFILDPQISVLGESTPSVSRLIGENKKVIPEYIESYLDLCESSLNIFKSITDQTTQLSHY